MLVVGVLVGVLVVVVGVLVVLVLVVVVVRPPISQFQMMMNSHDG